MRDSIPSSRAIDDMPFLDQLSLQQIRDIWDRFRKSEPYHTNALDAKVIIQTTPYWELGQDPTLPSSTSTREMHNYSGWEILGAYVKRLEIAYQKGCQPWDEMTSEHLHKICSGLNFICPEDKGLINKISAMADERWQKRFISGIFEENPFHVSFAWGNRSEFPYIEDHEKNDSFFAKIRRAIGI